ncbi:ABC transporter ATP-binding protein [Streptomyces sp. NBC_01298]|uniref:ABC transporter ATP-binding protein n=1 Tax=Streptomyces sp. NBC_01298 TaxID=2903817 RepID=UPI002E0F3CC1|nr:ABC transporter ATP-binding protein [Streptomyces sp. NBC_01298]
MRRYLTLWLELFGVSWRGARSLTAASLAAVVGTTVVSAGAALALRAAVDASASGTVRTAALGAAGAALAYALTMVLQDVTSTLTNTAADQVGRLHLNPRIHEDIAELEGLEHLERSDFLDRVTVVQGAAGKLLSVFWKAVVATGSILRILIAMLILGALSPWLLLLIAFAVVPVWCNSRGQRRLKEAELATAEAFRLQQHLFDLAVDPAGAKELQISGASATVARRQAEVWDELMAHRGHAQLLAAAWRLAGWATFAVAFVGGLALLVQSSAPGHGTAGDLVLLVTTAAGLRQSVQTAVTSTSDTAGAARIVEPYLWLREYAAAHRKADAGSLETPKRLREGLILQDVSYLYPGTEQPALDRLSLSVPAGSVVAVVGEYGSGKTTLVKLLCKFYRPDAGRILVDGKDLNDLETSGWRARSSAAFQDFGRFRTTFSETVGLGDLTHISDRERIEEALHAADAMDLVSRLPHGLDTQLGVELGGVNLSEGQWQRTALARASMRRDPLLFVLDEPTASLDAPSEQSIFERYMTRARALASTTGAITIIVSHRFSTVTDADLILVLDKGRLVESGTHDELMRVGGRYADLYGIQSTAYSTAGKRPA